MSPLVEGRGKVRPNDEQVAPVPRRAGGDFHPDWSPHGKKIVFLETAPETRLRSSSLERGLQRSVSSPAARKGEWGRCDADGRSKTLSSREKDDEYSLFFLAEYPRVVRTVFLMLYDRDAAQDVAQESFVELFRRWNRVSH